MNEIEECKNGHGNFILRALKIKVEIVEVDYKSSLAEDNAGGGDCTTRAISKALNMPYYDAMDLQMEKCKKYGFLLPNHRFITEEILEENGFTRMKLPIFNISVAEFLCIYNTGIYVILTKNHAFIYEEGIYYDHKYNLKNADDIISDKIMFVYKKEEK